MPEKTPNYRLSVNLMDKNTDNTKFNSYRWPHYIDPRLQGIEWTSEGASIGIVRNLSLVNSLKTSGLNYNNDSAKSSSRPHPTGTVKVGAEHPYYCCEDDEDNKMDSEAAAEAVCDND